MQATGHGGKHKPQPVQCRLRTVCMNLGAPEIASTGQAGRQSPHPMHVSSLITAISSTCLGIGVFSKFIPIKEANCSTVFDPPGGHKLIAAPSEIAWA